MPPDVPPGAPGRRAVLLAYLGVLCSGLLGGLLGFGVVSVGCRGNCDTAELVGAVAGAVLAGIGAGVVGVVVLRARAHWRVPGDGDLR